MSDTAFLGWLRLPGHLWTRVIEADSADDAWSLLHQHAAQLGAKTIDLLVGPADTDPRGRRRAPTQRRLFP